MNKEFIPYEQALELKELGFNEGCLKKYDADGDLSIDTQNGYYVNQHLSKSTSAPLYQQAFRWFREKYEFTYSIGRTNIAVIHYGLTTQLLQNNNSYEEAELACIKKFIEITNAE
jgi:hypothetical protein